MRYFLEFLIVHVCVVVVVVVVVVSPPLSSFFFLLLPYPILVHEIFSEILDQFFWEVVIQYVLFLLLLFASLSW